MNRFIRNNLLLIVIIAASGVVAILLFIFSILRYIEMTRCMTEIGKISKEVEQLSRKNPSPHTDNRKPLTANAALYNKLADQLSVYFVPRMKAVAEKFVTGLRERNPLKENDKIVPLTVERFRKDYEEMWNRGHSPVDKQYNYNNFRELRYTNWNEMVRKILPEAQKLTAEPLTEDTLPGMLFAYIGIPRIMSEQPVNMVRYLKDYQNALVNMMTSIKFNTVGTRVDWFGFDPDPTPAGIAQKFNFPRENYPQIVKVWDIYGDVIRRMTSCTMRVAYKGPAGEEVKPYSKDLVNKLTDEKKTYRLFDDKIDTFYGMWLRAAMSPAASSGDNNNPLRNAIRGDEEGPFRVYRLRISVGATMAGIRTLVKAFEEAYKEHHVYVVRSIALYADRDGALEIFRSRDDQSASIGTGAEEKKNVQPAVPRGRGRGRGRGAAAAPQPVQQSKIDPAVVEEMRRRQEEANKNLKFFERIGYGDVLIGDDKTCKAVIDFDCYELK